MTRGGRADMAGDVSLVFLGVTAFAVFFVGLAKAGFGGMIGSLAMPLVASVSGIITAVAVLLPVYVIIDLIVIYLYRKEVRLDVLWPMALAGLIGVVIGGGLLQILDPTLLQVILGLLSIAAAVQFAVRRHRNTPPPPIPSATSWPRALGWGGSSGVLSFFLMGEAPAQFYLLPFRLAPTIYVAVMVWYFAIVNVAKMPIMIGLGYVSLDTLTLSALFLPILPLGIWAGKWINTRIPKEPFYIIVHILLLALGIYLIASAVLS